MEQYGITELARLFGISAEAIRKYEAKDILNSVRNQDNQFRKYDIWDIGMLYQIRTLRELEFTLSEVKELLLEGELPELEAALGKKKEEAANMALKYQEHFRMLEKAEQSIHELTDRRDELWLEYSPAHYGIDFGALSLPEDGPLLDAIHVFIKRAPFAFFCGRFDEDQVFRGTRLAMEEQYITQEEVENLGNALKYTPSRLCACVMLGESHGGVFEKKLQKEVCRINECGYRVDGDIITKVVFWNKKAGDYFSYHRVWIPVEKIL